MKFEAATAPPVSVNAFFSSASRRAARIASSANGAVNLDRSTQAPDDVGCSRSPLPGLPSWAGPVTHSVATISRQCVAASRRSDGGRPQDLSLIFPLIFGAITSPHSRRSDQPTDLPRSFQSANVRDCGSGLDLSRIPGESVLACRVDDNSDCFGCAIGGELLRLPKICPCGHNPKGRSTAAMQRPNPLPIQKTAPGKSR